jgi:hypothetical protein
MPARVGLAVKIRNCNEKSLSVCTTVSLPIQNAAMGGTLSRFLVSMPLPMIHKYAEPAHHR